MFAAPATPISKTAVPLQKITIAIGSVAILLGLLVTVGWFSHQAPLIQLRPNFPPMQFNSALCFIFAGSALVAWVVGLRSRFISFLAGLTAAFSIATLAEYLFRINLGIDQLFVQAFITTATSHPGRMSPVSALCFTQIGIGLLLIAHNRFGRWGVFAVGSLASIVVSVCIMAILGYCYGLPGTYGWGHLTRIALHTASGLALLGTGLFAVAWQAGLREGERTPRWLPVPVGLGVFTASLILCFALDAKQNAEISQTVKAGSESVTNQIGVRMEARIRSLVRMARRWEFSGRPKQAEWENDATNYVRDFPDFQALEWIDASRITRWVVPIAGNEAKIDTNLVQEARRNAAVELAMQQHKPAVTRPVALFRGGLGFVIYVPVHVGERFDGWIAGVFKAQQLFERFLPPAVAEGEDIRLSDGKQIFYQRSSSPPPAREEWAVNSQISMHGTDWQVRIWPTPELATRLGSPLPTLVLLGGFIGSLLMASTVFLAQRSSDMARQTARTNRQLQAALDEVKELTGLLPICACCKRVRDDTGYWNKIESYVCRHSRASFSHGYCPECAVKAFQDNGLEVPEKIWAEHAARNYE